MSIKGRFVEGELSTPEDSIREELRYSTVSPVGSGKIALDVSPKKYYLKEEDFTIEGGDSNKLIKTNHGLKVGYMLRVKSTVNPWYFDEVSVMEVIDADTVRLAAVLEEGFTAGDTFDVYVPVSERVASDGSSLATVISPPIRFFKDGVETPVSEDTVDNTNSDPLPVKIIAAGGDININAGDIAIHTSSEGVNFDSMRIGDGTAKYAGITGDNELKTHDAAVVTAVAALKDAFDLRDIASDAEILNVIAKLQDILDYGIATEDTLVLVKNAVETLSTAGLATEATLNSLRTDMNTNSTELLEYLNDDQLVMLGNIKTAIDTLGTETTLALIKVALADSNSATALGSDLADGTLHSRLAHIAARLSQLSAKFAALGQNNSANSLSVVPANDATFPVSTSVPTTGTQNKGTLSSGANTTINAPVGARSFIIRNKGDSDGTLHWQVGGTADSTSFDLIPLTSTSTIECSSNISLYASQGSVNYAVQWFH